MEQRADQANQRPPRLRFLVSKTRSLQRPSAERSSPVRSREGNGFAETGTLTIQETPTAMATLTPKTETPTIRCRKATSSRTRTTRARLTTVIERVFPLNTRSPLLSGDITRSVPQVQGSEHARCSAPVWRARSRKTTVRLDHRIYAVARPAREYSRCCSDTSTKNSQKRSQWSTYGFKAAARRPCSALERCVRAVSAWYASKAHGRLRSCLASRSRSRVQFVAAWPREPKLCGSNTERK